MERASTPKPVAIKCLAFLLPRDRLFCSVGEPTECKTRRICSSELLLLPVAIFLVVAMSFFGCAAKLIG